MNEYQKFIKKVFSLQRLKPKLNLSDILKANAFLGFPNKNFKSIHVAGTNGKGSVATKIAYALTYSGYKTGLYTSPHILSYRERIAIDGQYISKNEVIEIFKDLFKLRKKIGVNLSFFEITTLLAFVYFYKKKIDFAVIETGLGGRLDATNIIIPVISVITSIGFDHTNILGNTLEAIAEEKAKIIKFGVPVVVGAKAHFKTIIKEAKVNKSELYFVKNKNRFFDIQNQEIAKKALTVLAKNYPLKKEAISKGLKIRTKARFEILKNLGPKALLYDVAHNVDAFLELKKALNLFYPNEKVRVILGFSKFKDIEGCVKIIMNFANFIHVISANNKRAVCQKEIEKVLIKFNFLKYQIINDTKKTFVLAKTLAQKNNELLLICGSFYVVNEAKVYLQKLILE